MKVLIIEDEIELLNSIQEYLVRENYICTAISDYKTACQKIWDHEYDNIILDVTLPDGNGIALLPEIKKNQPNCGIIIVSAKDSLEDRLKGLDLGADDYITKPFHLAELNSRIKSLNRRKFNQGADKVVFNEIEIDPLLRIVEINGRALDLTKKEYDLLIFMIINKKHILTKESIAEHLWGDFADTYDSFDFIYTHIKNLRKKIVDQGGRNYIATVYGIGYKFTDL